jgi:hypothetical protein
MVTFETLSIIGLVPKVWPQQGFGAGGLVEAGVGCGGARMGSARRHLHSQFLTKRPIRTPHTRSPERPFASERAEWPPEPPGPLLV